MKILTLSLSLLLLVAPALTWTTYGCWDWTSNKFHKDCMIAATSLITERAGVDNMAWIPPYLVTNTWGACTAKIRGNRTRVGSIYLLASFDQLDGFHGRGIRLRRRKNGTQTRRYPIPNLSRLVGSLYAWMGRSHPGSSKEEQRTELQKRVPDGARVVICGPPGPSFLYDKAVSAIGRMLDNISSNPAAGKAVVRGSVETISGSTVNALAIVTQLNAFENGWRDLYKNLGRGMIEGVMLAAFSNILSADLNAGVYHVYNKYDTILFSTIIILTESSGSSHHSRQAR
ncbi:hypothetical protein TWF569_000193 [Orbilia oligospora]|nr:hypothetical protein TWF569_000193 [Orbilia oligospora]